MLGLNRAGVMIAAALVLPTAAYAAPGLAPWNWQGELAGFEVYADHVAQESSLDDAAVDRLRATGHASDPAIFYREAWLRVEKNLSGGMSVDTLLRQTSD